MPPREIPGYYFDEEKQKYFKIEANHKVPTGHRSSREAVGEKRKRANKRRREHEQTRRKHAEKIKRSRILAHPITGASAMSLSAGLVNEPVSRYLQEQQATTFAAGLAPEWLWMEPRCKAVTHLCRYAPTMGMFLGVEHVDGIHHLAIGASSFCLGGPNINSGRIDYHSHDRMTSMESNTSGLILMTSKGPQRAPHAHIRRFAEPDGLAMDFGRLEILSDLRIDSHLMSVDEIHCSVAVPDSEYFVMGTSHGLYKCDAESNVTSMHQPSTMTREIAAIGAQSRNVVMAADFRSNVWLNDLRGPGETVRLKHPSRPTFIRSVDDWRVLIAGNNSKMSIYDLRMPKDYKSQKIRNQTRGVSFPYITFPEYTSSYETLGIDLNTSLNLIVTATPTNTIKSFSLLTGKPIRSTIEKIEADAPVRCIKFAPELQRDKWLDGVETSPGASSGMYSLLVGNGSRVEEWGCSTIQEDREDFLKPAGSREFI